MGDAEMIATPCSFRYGTHSCKLSSFKLLWQYARTRSTVPFGNLSATMQAVQSAPAAASRMHCMLPGQDS